MSYNNHGLGPSNLFTINVVCCTNSASKGEIEDAVKRALRDLADIGHVIDVYPAEVIVCVSDISAKCNYNP